MLLELQSSFDQYNQRREALLQNLASLSPNTLSKKLGADKWSLLQVVQHLIRAERAVLMNLPDPSLLVHNPSDIRSRLGYLIVIWVLRWGLPVPVPEPEMLPGGNETSLSALKIKWDRNMNWLKRYLDGLTRATAKRAVFRHPVTGPLTPYQALRVAHVHLYSHCRHVAKIIRRVGG